MRHVAAPAAVRRRTATATASTTTTVRTAASSTSAAAAASPRPSRLLLVRRPRRRVPSLAAARPRVAVAWSREVLLLPPRAAGPGGAPQGQLLVVLVVLRGRCERRGAGGGSGARTSPLAGLLLQRLNVQRRVEVVLLVLWLGRPRAWGLQGVEALRGGDERAGSRRLRVLHARGWWCCGAGWSAGLVWLRELRAGWGRRRAGRRDGRGGDLGVDPAGGTRRAGR